MNDPELTILIKDSTLPPANKNLFIEGECFKIVNVRATEIMDTIYFIEK